MRVRSAVLTLAFALTVSTAVQAQEEVTLGDKVRVSTEDDDAWTEGQLTGVENDTLSIAKGVEELHYRLGEIQAAERWEPKNPAVLLLSSTAGGAVGFWGVEAAFGETQHLNGDGEGPHLARAAYRGNPNGDYGV